MAISLPRQLKKVSDRALLKSIESGLEVVEAHLQISTQHADKIAGHRHVTWLMLVASACAQPWLFWLRNLATQRSKKL